MAAVAFFHSWCAKTLVRFLVEAEQGWLPASVRKEAMSIQGTDTFKSDQNKLRRKAARVDHPIHPLLGERWSPRAFATRPVERAKLLSLFEAARWAPSANNRQPWRFVVGTSDHPEDHALLVATLNERNRHWARSAPVLILVAAQHAPPPGRALASLYDVGLAVGNLTAQAVELGLVTHQMGGFDVEQARTTLGIPEGYAPVVVIALGYPGSPDALPADLRERELAPRSRKPLEDFVFEGHWQLASERVASR
jgi:nitroreductase